MKKSIMIAAVLLMSGCATQTYHINGGASSTPNANEMQNFFVDGIGQTQELDAAKICGGADKVVKVESKQEALDVLLAMVTGGIYTPRHAKVYCKR